MRPLTFLMVLLCAPACQRRNPVYCDGMDLLCEPGMRCEVESRRCVPEGPPPMRCASSSSCPDERPLCDKESGLCRGCQEDAECLSLPRAGLAPICDEATRTCRPCRLHRECASAVCAKDDLSDPYGVPRGSCAPADQVMVVDASLCHEAGPVFCTAKQAVDRLDRQRRYVVFRRSARPEDFSEIQVGSFANQGVEIALIGPLADGSPVSVSEPPRVEIGMADRRGFIIAKKTRVTVEGFLIRGARVGIQCSGDGPGSDTQLRVLRSLLADNHTALAISDECHLLLSQSWVGRPPRNGPFAGIPGNGQSIDIIRSNFDIESSVISENGDDRLGIYGGIRITRGLGGGPDGKHVSTIVNTTFFGHVGWVRVGMTRYTTIVCDEPVGGRLVVLNTLLFQDPMIPLFERYITPGCGDRIMNSASDDPTLSTNLVIPRGEPVGFRDLHARDLHLAGEGETPAQRTVRRGGAPMLTSGSTVIEAPGTDLDGRPRPKSKGYVAMGAYEPLP